MKFGERKMHKFTKTIEKKGMLGYRWMTKTVDGPLFSSPLLILNSNSIL